ncbi:helix-turn-helix transcriptional regulator [Ligilactobacillus sp. LYQ60]|uniref:helix-turn-helix transcriptional regulator n=1 Tax=unclassified Ligilactobacillus TaxID=2767920 RepID=UPI0038518BE1
MFKQINVNRPTKIRLLHTKNTRNTTEIQIDFLEAHNEFIAHVNDETIHMKHSDVLVGRHLKKLIIIPTSNTPATATLLSISLQIPYPINTHLMADNPLFHDLMTDTQSKSTYIKFQNIIGDLIHNYFNILISLETEPADFLIDFQIQRVTALLMTELLRKHREYISKYESCFPSTHIKYASKDSQAGSIMQYISDNIYDVTLNKVANHFSYHPKYFSRLCNELFNCSFSQLINNIRIERACLQLTLTTKSLAEIASEIGYQNPTSFYRNFMRVKGIPPRKYRQIYNKLNTPQH